MNSSNTCEVTMEVEYSKDIDELIKNLQQVEGVRNVNLVTYTNDYGL